MGSLHIVVLVDHFTIVIYLVPLLTVSAFWLWKQYQVFLNLFIYELFYKKLYQIFYELFYVVSRGDIELLPNSRRYLCRVYLPEKTFFFVLCMGDIKMDSNFF